APSPPAMNTPSAASKACLSTPRYRAAARGKCEPSNSRPRADYAGNLQEQKVHDLLLLIRHLLPRRDDGSLERMPARPRLVFNILGHRSRNELLDTPEVLLEERDHRLRADMLAGVIEPAVIVGSQ